jgi:hypothetical protein
MDAVELEDFGGRAEPGFDNTPPMNAAILALANRPNKTLRFRAGTYTFNSKPLNINDTLRIEGQGVNGTTLVRNYNESVPETGFLHIHGPNCQVARLGIVAGNGTVGGAAIALVTLTVSHPSPDWCVFEDLYLSGGGQWDYTFYAFGRNRPTDVPGVRDLVVRNVWMFAARRDILHLDNVNNAWISGGFFPAGGTTNTVTIRGDADHSSHNIMLQATYLDALILSYCRWVTVLHSGILTDVRVGASVQDFSLFPPLPLGSCPSAVGGAELLQFSRRLDQ